MDHDSPFARHVKVEDIAQQKRSLTIHVLFCEICNHVWKAPSDTKKCTNCTNPGGVRSLVSYISQTPIT